MKNKILINGIILVSLLTCGCLIPNLAYADETQLSSMELANINTTEMGQYIKSTRRSIKNIWYPPTTSFENSAIIKLTIDRNGKLVNCSLIKPSPDEGFNNSLIEAATKAKYMPLPKDFIEDVVDLSLEFGMQRRYVQHK